MGLNRISSGLLTSQSLYYLNNNLSMLSHLQEKISSGKNINRPSDDPIGLTRLVSISNTLTTNDRYDKNIERGLAEASTADTALNSMVGLVQRAQELATQAANFTNNQVGRDAIALEINQIIDQMVQLGNTQVGGRYIFGGFQTTTPPFARPSQNVITYAGSAPASSWQRTVEIAQGISITININGQSLLGTANGVAGPLPVAVAGSGVFQTMVRLLMSLQAGGDPLQLQEIRNQLDNLTTDLNTISGSQSSIGAISNRLQQTSDRIQQQKSELTQQYAKIQEVDNAKTISDLNYQQNVFQASLGVTARVLQSSLLDFLR